MKNLIKLIIILPLLWASSAFAVKVNQCNNCNNLAMESMALQQVQAGTILIFDPVNEIARKYLVSKDFEMPWRPNIATQINLSTHDIDYSDAMYVFHKEGVSASNPQTYTMNMADYPQFAGITAYDVFYQSNIRNDIGDQISQNITNIITLGSVNTALAEAFNKAFLAALNGALDVDLSASIVVTFTDGSNAVYNLDVDTGMVPYHNRNDVRNTDANNNAILSEVTNTTPNVFRFTTDEQRQSFVDAAGFWSTVTVINGTGGGGSGNGGTMRCVAEAGARLVCEYTPQ